MTPKIEIDLDDAEFIRSTFKSIHKLKIEIDSLYNKLEALFNMLTEMEVGTYEEKIKSANKQFKKEIRYIEYN
tara:strand:+ start:513 stop:731 length:219 start_codon:yes stop_codon:yes gene_type:complete